MKHVICIIIQVITIRLFLGIGFYSHSSKYVCGPCDKIEGNLQRLIILVNLMIGIYFITFKLQ